jgi:signal transduction histidine kinase
LHESTTYKLIRPIEVVALLLLSTNIATSLLNDRYRHPQRAVMIGLLVVHLALAAFCLRQRGPLTRGGEWPAVWLAAMVVMPLVVADSVAPGDYGSAGVGVQMGGYAMIALSVFVFHPWLGTLRHGGARWAVEAALVAVVALEPWFILLRMYHGQVLLVQLKSVAVHAIWTVVWYAVGHGIRALCRIAVVAESKALVRSYDEALDGFHTHVETAYLRLRAGHDMRDVANELNQVIYERRRLLLMESERVSLAAIFKNATRLFGDALDVTYDSPGPLTAHRDAAIVLEQGLKDLLKNVVAHGGGRAEVTLVVEDRVAVLTVRDFGPGFDAIGPGTENLDLLRRRARDIGGDLVKVPSEVGAVLRLRIPLNPGR